MKRASQYQPNLAFGLLLIGPPKQGKTTICMNFPNPYFADCDNNLSGAVRNIKARGGNPDFYYDTINIADDSDECKAWGLQPGDIIPSEKRWTRLVSCCKAAVKEPWVKTIVIDSLSAVNDYLCDHIVSQKSADKEKFMTISDWTPYKNLMTKLVTSMRSTSKLFVMTAHESVEKDEGTGVMIFKPHMQSKLQDNFGGFFSDVWFTVGEKIGTEYKYYVKTMPTARRALGNSLGLPEDFTFTREKFEKILGTATSTSTSTSK